MASVPLSLMARYCDRALRTADVNDYDGAHNGLQAQNRGRVSRRGIRGWASTTS